MLAGPQGHRRVTAVSPPCHRRASDRRHRDRHDRDHHHRGADQALRRDRGPVRGGPQRAARDRPRPARPQRRRQDHHGPDSRDAAPPGRRAGAGLRARRGPGRAPPDVVPGGREVAVSEVEPGTNELDLDEGRRRPGALGIRDRSRQQLTGLLPIPQQPQLSGPAGQQPRQVLTRAQRGEAAARLLVVVRRLFVPARSRRRSRARPRGRTGHGTPPGPGQARSPPRGTCRRGRQEAPVAPRTPRRGRSPRRRGRRRPAPSGRSRRGSSADRAARSPHGDSAAAGAAVPGPGPDPVAGPPGRPLNR